MLPFLARLTLSVIPEVGICKKETDYNSVESKSTIEANVKTCIQTSKSLYFDTLGEVTIKGKKSDNTDITSVTNAMVATCVAKDSITDCFYEIESTKELKLIEFDIKNQKENDKTFLVLSDNYKGQLFATPSYKYNYEVINPNKATVTIDYSTSAYKKYIASVPKPATKISLEISGIENEEFISVPFSVKGEKGNLPNQVFEVEPYKFYSRNEDNSKAHPVKEIQITPSLKGFSCESYVLANDQTFDLSKSKPLCIATDKVLYLHSDENIQLKGKRISKNINTNKPGKASDIESTDEALIATCGSAYGENKHYCFYELTADANTKLNIFSFPLIYINDEKQFNIQKHKLAAMNKFSSQISLEYAATGETKDIRIGYQLINPNGVSVTVDNGPDEIRVVKSELNPNNVFVGLEPAPETYKPIDKVLGFQFKGNSKNIDFTENELTLEPLTIYTKPFDKGLIIGISVACIAVVIIIALVVWFICWKRAKAKAVKEFENNEQALENVEDKEEEHHHHHHHHHHEEEEEKKESSSSDSSTESSA